MKWHTQRCPDSSKVKVARSVVSDSATHVLYSPWNSPGQNTGVGSLSLLQGIFPMQGSNPSLPPADSLPVEPRGKPKNPGVGSLYFLQWIVPIQELNRGLLHCRQILYQLSYWGNPRQFQGTIKRPKSGGLIPENLHSFSKIDGITLPLISIFYPAYKN